MEENSKHHRTKTNLISLHNLIGPASEITEQQYKQNESDIEAIREAQALCETCQGKECRQGIKGYLPIFKCFCGQYSMSLYPCPYNELIRRKDQTRELQRQSNIPHRYARLTFADLKKLKLEKENRPVAVELLKLAKRPGENTGIYLHGKPGVGKTMLLSILGNTLLKAGKKVLFCNTAELLNQLRQRIKSDWNEELARYQKVPCLILDDVGTAKLTEWGMEQMFRLLDARYREERQTLFTSNYSLEEFQKKLLECRYFDDPTAEQQAVRLISRMAGMTRQFQLIGEDKRWKTAASIFEAKPPERKKDDDDIFELQTLFP